MVNTLERCNELATPNNDSIVQNKHSLFNRANLFACNRFFGNMPLTALRKTSPPPHFSIILSIVMLFRLPGRVLCV